MNSRRHHRRLLLREDGTCEERWGWAMRIKRSGQRATSTQLSTDCGLTSTCNELHAMSYTAELLLRLNTHDCVRCMYLGNSQYPGNGPSHELRLDSASARDGAVMPAHR